MAEMGTKKEAPSPPPPTPSVVAPAHVAPAANSSTAPVKGGKNALLARIMAAKEKQQQKEAAPPTPAAPTTTDLLMDFDVPPTETELPPPSYETNFLKDVPPPAFGVLQQQFPPPPPIDSVLPPPPPLNDVLPPPPMPEGDLLGFGFPSAPTASAPMFEDLHTQQQEHHPPPLAPPMDAAPPVLDIDDSILNALEPAEREAFLEEQRKILEQIEKEKSNNEASGAAARAMAFDQRSSSAVASVAATYEQGGRPQTSSSSSRPSTSRSDGRTVNLGGGAGEVAVHGSEKTQQAIDDGTAVIVKCMSCDNWMQVTEAAELMFCPICQVVCPVEKKGAATTANMEAAAQLAADAELAEKLQKEEYAAAEQGRSRSTRTQQPSRSQEQSKDGQSWYDWITGSPAPAPATRSNISSSGSRGGGGLVSAQTGEEARSYDVGGGARVAQTKSMFSCVADSINTAASQMYTLSADEEGNVHGVDSAGLLAMPDVSRERQN